MFDNYKLTAAERRAIESGYAVVADHARSDYELNSQAMAEQHGYGNRSDHIPLIAAKALIVKWFTEGVQSPNQLLRDTFTMRPAALWATGTGAQRAEKVTCTELQVLRAACRAHIEAFNRSLAKV